MEEERDIQRQFLKAYDELSDALFRRFFFKLSDREKALDLVQEVFTKTWLYLSEGKEIQNIKSFLFTTANHMIVDEYRKKKSISLDFLSEGGFDVGEDLGHIKLIENTEIQNTLKCVEQLPQKYKEIIMMRYVDGLAIEEIANVIGETENVVSVRISRAIKKIQEIMHLQ